MLPCSKSLLRRSIIEKRDSIEPSLRTEKNKLIKERLTELKEFREAMVILLYASFRSEPDTHGLIKECLLTGKRVFLPRVNKEKRELEIREIISFDQLKESTWGIPEPPEDSPLRDINDAELIIIPGVAFDRRGGRIGYGAGYYDKLLSGLKKKVPVIAIAYDEQIVKEIPLEPHDKLVDLVITDREVIYCGYKKD